MTDIADQHQRPALDRGRLAVRRGELGVTLELAGEGLAALGDLLGEVALHQGEPVAVDENLVLGIDGGDGILAIHDGGDGGFERDIADAGGIGLADHAVGVDEDQRVQAVGGEVEPVGVLVLTLEAGILLRISERGLACGSLDLQLAVLEIEARGIGPLAACERHAVVQEGLGPGDDAAAAFGIVAAGLGQIAQRIGAVERIVERAPTGIGGIERIAGVHHRDDELRAGNGGDLRVDMAGRNLDRAALGDEVADLAQEILVGVHVRRRAVLAVPGVDLGLHLVALLQKPAVFRTQFVDGVGKRGEESLRLHPGAGDRLVDDEIVEFTADRQAVFVDVRHVLLP